ncbi:MAG: hypothetical protein ACREVW_11060 [Burkholderiales bacterium]
MPDCSTDRHQQSAAHGTDRIDEALVVPRARLSAARATPCRLSNSICTPDRRLNVGLALLDHSLFLGLDDLVQMSSQSVGVLRAILRRDRRLAPAAD